VYDAEYAWLNLMMSPHYTSALANEVILNERKKNNNMSWSRRTK
jgi:hypothetical protein